MSDPTTAPFKVFGVARRRKPMAGQVAPLSPFAGGRPPWET